jgi:trigger factor
MQVTATQTEGLKREFRVVVPATELDQKMLARLDVLKDQVKINGFRPGKVPVSHLKKVYGRSAMAEVIENAVRDANTQIVNDNNFKLATDPKITMPTEKAEVEELINGKSDLSYTVELEIVPEIKLGDFKAIKLEKLVADVSDAEIDKALAAIADQNKPFADKGEGTKAEDGDKLIVSFTGKLEGVPFEGGTGEDIGVNLGSNTFIPGFEPQLVGMTAGETRTIKVTFPKNYMSDTLAGKDAEFEVTAKSIEAPGTVTIDDAFAISLGLESLDKLKDAVKERLQKEHTQATRQKLKRGLLDALDETHKFEPPPTLVTEEFEAVWRSVAGEIESQGRTFADEGTDEESAKAEYQKIAERRVRLGLVLAEIGDKNNIKVADDEMTRAVVDKARQMPGREQEVWDYYRNNPQALASLRAPIFEEKVVDFLLELATVTEKNVPVEELYKEAD